MSPDRNRWSKTHFVSRRETGATLIVTLIMLVMLTLIIFTAARLSTSNLTAAGNFQYRYEAMMAGNYAIEHTIDLEFSPGTTPSTLPPPVSVDIDSDGTNDYSVQTQITCLRSRIVPTAELDISKPEDQGCFLGMGSGAGGLSGAAGTQSLCADTLWDIQATATHARTGARVTIHQGLKRRIHTSVASSMC